MIRIGKNGTRILRLITSMIDRFMQNQLDGTWR